MEVASCFELANTGPTRSALIRLHEGYLSCSNSVLGNGDGALIRQLLASMDQQYSDGRQQDAYEFFSSLLNGLDDCFTRLSGADAAAAQSIAHASLGSALRGVAADVP